MTNSRLSILLVEDDRDDYLLVRDLLAEHPGYAYRLEWAPDYTSGLNALVNGSHDVILLDYHLGAKTGLELVEAAMEAGCRKPTLLLTGQNGAELDRKALAAGVADYLEKGRFNGKELSRAIQYAVQQQRHAEELEHTVAKRTVELAAANIALQEVNQRRTEFLALLAHELRNPLAPIRHGLQTLKRNADPATTHATVDMMERQLRQMVHLIDDLLDVSRISRGKIELQLCRVELEPVVQQAVEAVTSAVETLGHELVVSLPPQPVYLNADATRLTQVLGNLLNNACKFTAPGGRIALLASVDAHELTIRVRDNGTGIPAEHLPHIFEMFTQVNTSLDSSRSGLGIGLSLVKNLVEMHGGTVEALSAGPGEGTEIVLRLPVVTGAAPIEAAPAPMATATGSRRRILIVDDNRDSASSLALLLELDGHETHTAPDGIEALAAAERLRPEIVLLDIGLPQLDGYAVCRALRERPWSGASLIVALTGWGQEDDRRKSLEAGFDHHLLKPVDHAALTQILARKRVIAA
ncbi:MAG: response regulator [Panacagrimonas sp.]